MSEQTAYRVVKRYRRRMDEAEDLTARRLALRFERLNQQILKDLKTLKSPDPLNLPVQARFIASGTRDTIARRLVKYADEAGAELDTLAKRAALYGIRSADQSAREVVTPENRSWEKITAAGLLGGNLFKASKEALTSLPGSILSKIQELAGAAASMAEGGFDWLLSKVGEAVGKIWPAVQRIIRTAAEQIFRRAQEEQLRRTPVPGYRRIANHETACLACLMLEGHIYDRREDFSDHPNGRCYIVPVEPGAQDDHRGRDWLEQQDEETQRKILGKTRYEAWKNGELSLDQMTDTVQDPVYGPLPHIIPLRDLGLQL